MRKILPLTAILLLSACAGAQLASVKQENAALREKDAALLVQMKNKSAAAAAAEAAKSEAESKLSSAQSALAAAQASLAEVEGKLKIANSRVDGLTKSNKDLSDSIGASQNELGGKLNAVIAEKDAVSKTLADAQKEKLGLDRAMAVYRSARDKAQADLAKVQKAKDALDQRLADSDREKGLERQKLDDADKRLHDDMGAVADAVLKEIQDGKASADVSGGRFLLTLSEPLLFDEGSAKIQSGGAALLERVGNALKALGAREIRVEGYTDNGPIKKGLLGGFDDHWSLSAARAAAAARWLHEHAGLDPAHLSAVGYGEFHPVQPNESDGGRAANRRLVVAVEPVATPLTK